MNLNKSELNFIEEIKNEFKKTQLRVITKVNSELINFYFYTGEKLLEKQKNSNWGDKILISMSKSFVDEGIGGFSISNLKNMRKFHRVYVNDELGQQLVVQIPWGHNIVIMNKVESIEERHWYIKKTIENGWSRKILEYNIETNLFDRDSKKLIENFNDNLPPKQSDLARDIFRDKYVFDFINQGDKLLEVDFERTLIANIKKFILELGCGFSFIGNQFKLEVDSESYFVDLLFFNRDLNCLVAIELKTGKFKPEFAGKMNFYLNLLKKEVKKDHENNPIGIILCKEKHKVVAELAIEGTKTPIAVSEFAFALEKNLNVVVKEMDKESGE